MRLLSEPVCDPFYKGEKPVIVMKIFNFKQPVRIQLDPTAAPITVSYILSLVESGFYNGLTFHRIIPRFMIQGGDPLGTGDGETDCYVKGEFAQNGIENPLKHKKGTISLARQDDCDSASCQFFIMLRDIPSMDGEYAAFGQVIEGMEVIDSIGRSRTDAADRPLVPIYISRVYIEE